MTLSEEDWKFFRNLVKRADSDQKIDMIDYTCKAKVDAEKGEE